MRLKELREEKGLSQISLAERLNLSQPAISFYETGERSPDIETLISLARFFNVSTDYLLGISEYRNIINKADISVFEAELFSKCKLLNTHQKENLMAYVKGMLHHQ